jgi:hypothetical protein
MVGCWRRWREWVGAGEWQALVVAGEWVGAREWQALVVAGEWVGFGEWQSLENGRRWRMAGAGSRWRMVIAGEWQSLETPIPRGAKDGVLVDKRYLWPIFHRLLLLLSEGGR